MPFGRSYRPNNRSQHNLVESAGPAGTSIVPGPGPSGQGISPSGVAGAGLGFGGPGQAHEVQSQGQRQGPSSALDPSNTASFVQHPRAANQQPPPPPHLYTSTSASASSSASGDPISSAQLHALNTANVFPEARVRKAATEFVDAVARSQSQRYPQVATPIQPNPSYGASYEDLPTFNSPQQHQHQSQQEQEPPIAYQHQQQQSQQQQQGPPVESRRSTRRLIKNILAGTPNPGKADQNRGDHSHHHSQSQSYYNNTAGLARRPSKRVSNPPALRTGPSQVSLDQHSIDWQSQGSQVQPSPLQSNPHDFQQSTLRRVPTGQDTSPYPDDGGFIHPQGQIHIQTQLTADQQQPLGQVAFDPATRQYQFITHSPQRQGQPEVSLPAYPSHLSAERLRNPETVSQLSHDSPGADGDHQTSSNVQSTATSPAVRYSAHVQDLPSRTSSLQPLSHQGVQQQDEGQLQEQQHLHMAPPAGGPPQARGSQDTDKVLGRGSADMHAGPPPSYRHSQPPNNMNPLPAVPQGAQGQNSNFRQSSLQERQQFDGAGEQGRANSPQPPEDPEKAFKDLLTKYKNVKRLYFDGKTQIEQLSGQVEQLQNAVANQRITQSRTSLDDNEYTTRFNRLNGAINNLSFNIRKDWDSLPAWVDKYVSTDALKTGKQEMTAVGRAVITRWLVDEIFHGCFHPGLDPALSRHLKEIEQNIRRFSYTLNSREEHDALTSKVVSWRMATLDGLQHVLQSEDSAKYRQDFISKATADLVAYIFQHLTDPPPAGVDGSASMIVELAVSIAANLPIESRDVAVVYPLPQETIQPNFMEVEKAPLPAIETRSPDGDGDADSRGEDNAKDSGGEKSSSKERNKSRAGMSTSSTLSSLLSNASSALVPGSSNSRKGSVASVSQQSPSARKQSIATSLTDSTTNLALPPKDSNKVRFAGFLAVDVRGRQVLVKAPVWTLG